MARSRFSSGNVVRPRKRVKKFGGFGMRSNPLNVVTAERDFSYTQTATKRKKPRWATKALRYKKRKWLRYKKKIRAAIKPPKTKVKFYYAIGRSWVAGANTQAVAIFPICSYRGIQSTSANVSVAASPTTPPQNVYLARQDDANQIFQSYDSVFYPVGASVIAAENQTLKNVWFGIKRATIDVTITNTGTTTNGENSNVPAEYEIYMVWPKKTPTDNGINMQGPIDWINQARKYTETRVGGDVIASSAGASYLAWHTWSTANVKKYVKSKLIGRGYLAVGESTRFYKAIKTRFWTDRKKWEEDDPNVISATNDPWKRGLSVFVMICWRGTPATGSATGGWGNSRLNFNINKEIDTYTTSTPLQPGDIDGFLFPTNNA